MLVKQLPKEKFLKMLLISHIRLNMNNNNTRAGNKDNIHQLKMMKFVFCFKEIFVMTKYIL